jgi:drug/metabolite transporter (DMT)-like permease
VRSRQSVGAAIVVLAAICFGTLGPLSRFADAAGVESLTLVAWRAALGAGAMILLLGVRSASGRPVVSLRAVPRSDRWFVVAGALANAFLNLAMFIAFVRIEIGLALLVFYSYPAFVAVASIVWFGERLDALRWSALGISMLGLALTLTGAGGIGQIDVLGISLAFLAALTQAFYVLAARHGFEHVPGVESAAFTMGGAALVYLVISVATGVFGDLAQPIASTDALAPSPSLPGCWANSRRRLSSSADPSSWSLRSCSSCDHPPLRRPITRHWLNDAQSAAFPRRAVRLASGHERSVDRLGSDRG